MQLQSNDYRRAFFITRLVELLHHRMLVGIDGDHGKADHQFARGRVDPSVQEAGYAERVARGQFNLPAHHPTRLEAGSVKVVNNNQAILRTAPGRAVTGLFCCGLTPGVVDVPTDFVVLGP